MCCRERHILPTGNVLATGNDSSHHPDIDNYNGVEGIKVSTRLKNHTFLHLNHTFLHSVNEFQHIRTTRIPSWSKEICNEQNSVKILHLRSYLGITFWPATNSFFSGVELSYQPLFQWFRAKNKIGIWSLVKPIYRRGVYMDMGVARSSMGIEVPKLCSRRLHYCSIV